MVLILKIKKEKGKTKGIIIKMKQILNKIQNERIKKLRRKIK